MASHISRMNQRFNYGSLGPIAYPTYPSGKRSSCPSMMTVFHQRVTKINCTLAFQTKNGDPDFLRGRNRQSNLEENTILSLKRWLSPDGRPIYRWYQIYFSCRMKQINCNTS